MIFSEDEKLWLEDHHDVSYCFMRQSENNRFPSWKGQRLNWLLYLNVSGREWSDWSSELRIPGDELKWKFISDGSVNGWGWRFTVYPIMPAAGESHVLFQDRNISLYWHICSFHFSLELLASSLNSRKKREIYSCVKDTMVGI